MAASRRAEPLRHVPAGGDGIDVHDAALALLPPLPPPARASAATSSW
jgi:hypothetical protein